MKRLMIAATLLLATTSMSVWAQAPAANDAHHPPPAAASGSSQPTPPAAMPMTNCGGNSGATTAEGQKGNCSMAPGNMKSGEGAMTTHQMMHDMMHGQPRPVVNQHDHGHNGMKCCELSKADKPQ